MKRGSVSKLMSLFFLLTLALSKESMAEIYKWTDKNGKVHFGDNKNSPQESSVKVDLKPTNTMDAVEVRMIDKSVSDKPDAAARMAEEEKLRKEARYWERKNCKKEEVFSHHGGMRGDGVTMRREVFTRTKTVCSRSIPSKYSRYITVF